MIIKGIEYKDYIETNIGNIPLEDYLDIMAHQNGFDDYDEMYDKGYRLKGYENLSPNDILDYKNHLYDDELRGDFKPIENDNIISVHSLDNTNNVADNDSNGSYISNGNISKYHQDFINYCEGKVRDLPDTKDNNGQSYTTFLICSIYGQNDNSIVYVKGHENELCWKDNNTGQINCVLNNAPDMLAIKMNFKEIDRCYLNSLNEYWDGLRLDEFMQLNEERLLSTESLNSKEM